MNPNEPRLLRVEAVADLPVLWTTLQRLDLVATLDRHFPAPANWKGLLQFGHSKDDPDRPQIKIAAAVLDPLGLPLTTAVVPGNSTDDPLYIPAIQAVQQSFGIGGRTYVGDCKMAALATRAFVAAGEEFYLCPLSEDQISRAQRRVLLQPLFEGTQALQQVWRPGGKGQPDERVAVGFRVDVGLTATVGGQAVRWTEQRWLVRSQAY